MLFFNGKVAMGKENYNKEKDKYQKIFNENKQLKHDVARLKSEIERAKKPCKCQKPEKEYPMPIRQDKPQKRVEAVREISGGSCPLCSGVTIKAEYTRQGEEWALVRCTEPNCKYRTNGKKV